MPSTPPSLTKRSALAHRELKVVTSQGTKTALLRLMEAFQSLSEISVTLECGTSEVLTRRIAGGMPFDVLILSERSVHALARDGRVSRQHLAEFGRTCASVAYWPASSPPDVSSLDALGNVLRSARSISFSDPAQGGTSSNLLMEIVKHLGISEEISRKTILTKPGEGAFPVAERRAEIGVAQGSEIAAVSEVLSVPLLPSHDRCWSNYQVAIAAQPERALDAFEFFKFVTSKDSLHVRERMGLAMTSPGGTGRGLM